MKVLINADDFGLTKGVTDGIVKAHQKGIVQSTTMMMNGQAVDYAIEQAKNTPTLHVGVHLVLTAGKPLSTNVESLVNEDGTFYYTSAFNNMEAPNLQEAEREWRAQIDAFVNTGLSLHHLDSHHHIHGWEPLKDIVLTLADEYQVPVRYVPSLQDHRELLLTDSLWTGFYGEGIYSDLFQNIKLPQAASVEIMTHPGFADEKLETVSSYVEQREKELHLLCNMEVPEWADMETP
ncbi:chitin disaccharide deacetylase [Salinicoccus carnicancri]|uniref:chitin disaccharide deacetylase n=1 Tax=Salinicoccus carnicancri TaxID=558170 RepID=UPI00030D5143|nr:chitin disaccharide deacetylase [Salinicoccus carnicancri]